MLDLPLLEVTGRSDQVPSDRPCRFESTSPVRSLGPFERDDLRDWLTAFGYDDSLAGLPNFVEDTKTSLLELTRRHRLHE